MISVLQIGSYAFGQTRFGEDSHIDDLTKFLRGQGLTVHRAGLDPFDMRLAVYAAGSVPVQTDSFDDVAGFFAADFVARLSLLNQLLDRILDRLDTTPLDAVHLHSELAAPVAVSFAQRRSLPLIYTVHVVNEIVLRISRPNSIVRYFLSALQADLLRRADVVVVPSQATANELSLLAPAVRTVVIPHELPTRPPPKQDYRLDGRAPRLLFAGRLMAVKGISAVLPALARLTPQPELWLVGSGPEEDRVRGDAERLGMAVRPFGWLPREELFRLYREADLLIFPSLAETYGMVLAEAMAAGLPVVAHDLPSVAERVTHGENGMLIRVPAGVERALHELEWTTTVSQLLGDESWRRKLGTRARTSTGAAGWHRYRGLYREPFGHQNLANTPNSSVARSTAEC
jgi:glycosyltransferase involved in cell wall biosynthesis